MRLLCRSILLSQYCAENGIKYKLLYDYIENRDKWLLEIMDTHETTCIN